MSDMQNNGQNNTRNDEVQKNILKEKKSSQSSENLSVTKNVEVPSQLWEV